VTTTRRPAALAAAGGVLWRKDGTQLHVALVHRPRYDDWTLPKGKLAAGEHPLMGAVREITEETGARACVGRRLSTVEYLVGATPKRVSYWAMRYLDGDHVPNVETDELRWLTVAEANRLLTYPVDRGVLADFARLPANGSIVLLMRHGKAGRRTDWRGEDRKRPLDKIGRRQARDAVPFLQAFGPVRVLAADRVRCEQTVAPFAATADLQVESTPEFSDEAYLANPRPALKSFEKVAESGATTLICSQGKAIPQLLADLDVPAAGHVSRKGSLWALSWHRGSVVAADYYPHPIG